MSKKPEDFALEVNTLHCTVDALEKLREVFLTSRVENDLTKTQLADLVGRDLSYVSRILNGRVSNVNYQTLARFFLAMGYWPTP